jgi:site-specific recombinase XerD
VSDEAKDTAGVDPGTARRPAPRGSGRVFRRTGSAFWWIAYCVRGREKRESSGETDPRKAEKRLRARLDEVGADRLGLRKFVGPKQDKVTVGELLDDLEADYKIRKVKALPSFKSHLAPMRAAFGHRLARAITSAEVDRYIEARREAKKADATINRETQLLGQAFKLAMRREPPKISGAPTIRHLRENNARQVFVENGDFEAIVAGLPAYLQDMFRFARLVAWRKGEFASLPWTQVDRHGKGLRLLDSKNGHGRFLALPDGAWTIIERRWAAREYSREGGTTALSTLVFHRHGRRITDYRKAWATACEAAGLQAGRKVEGGLVPHDLRRTGVRSMRRAGVAETVAMAISGHRTRAVFDRYNITDERDLQDAVAKTHEYLKAQTVARRVTPLVADGASR